MIEAAPQTLSPADLATIAERFGLPDMSGMNFETMAIEDKVYVREMVLERLAIVGRVFQELTRPANEIAKSLTGEIKAEIQRNGGKRLAHDTFDVVLTQAEEPEKRMDILTQLRFILDEAECNKIFKRTVEIKGNIDDDTLQKVRDLCPGVKIDVKLDADGTALNSVAKNYGAESDAGKIVAAGYVKVPKGEPKLVITPKESAMKKVS